MRLVERCFLIAGLLRCPIVLENVRTAQRWFGRSHMNCGPFHLWGHIPAILPVFDGRKKESYGGRQKAERAKVPLELAVFIGKCFK